MYNSLNPLVLDKAGTYNLSQVNLISYVSANGSGNPSRLNITQTITEVNVYEHLENNTLSGDVTIVDANNIVENFPLTGFERIEFTLETPGLNKGYDFSVASGHPMFIYNIENRQEANPRAQVYTLKFCSMEVVKNAQRRVSNAFAGTIDEMILQILRYDLKTKKDIIVEETKGSHKFVMPRSKPFEAINMLRSEAVAKKFTNAGFLFYENAIGFNFRSYESLFCTENGSPRKEMAFYTPKAKNIRDGQGNKNIISDFQSVESFRIISQFNTLKNLHQGTYASRLVTHDMFSKVFTEVDFDYHTDYEQHKHLELDPKGGVIDNNGILPYFNFEEGKAFSDFAEGTLLFDSNTSKVHNDYELPNPTQILQQRISQKSALGSLVLELNIPGFTGINVGDVVHFDLPSYRRASRSDVQDVDKFISGRYIISGIRHHISAITKKHTSIIEIIKDSFSYPYAEEDIDLFTNNENDTGDNYLQYDIDKSLT